MFRIAEAHAEESSIVGVFEVAFVVSDHSCYFEVESSFHLAREIG
jgi:hypothetical protein